MLLFIKISLPKIFKARKGRTEISRLGGDLSSFLIKIVIVMMYTHLFFSNHNYYVYFRIMCKLFWIIQFETF